MALKPTPMRSMNDFLLDSRRYISPTFNDLKRLNNRIVSNLLYYQTNYFAVSVITFSLFLLFGTDRMFWGCLALATNAITGLLLTDRLPLVKAPALPTPARIPLFGLILWSTYTCFRQILFVKLSILLPILFWIAHAATRSRGIKNKLINAMDSVGASVYANSPMGYYLAKFGLEPKDLEE